VNKQTVAGVFIALVLGGMGGYWFATGPGSKDMAPRAGKSPAPAGARVLFYRNPMNPEITSPVPAQDAMGMDYTPVYAGDPAGASADVSGTVSIDPVTVQNIGVRTATAVQQTLSRQVRAAGRVDYDEERLARLHPKTEGWIEQLFIDKTGESIGKDAILLSIYSPQLVTSQQEYLLALNSLDVLKQSPYEEIRRGAEQLVSSSRERLELLDVPEHQIHELEHTRRIRKDLHIQSPFDGVIINIGAREGQFVTSATELYRIADLSRVWVFAEVYENEVSWIQTGDPAEMKLAAYPGKVFSGSVGYVYPYAEASSRTIKVRLEFDNKDLLLKPDLYAEVTILAQRKVDAIVIPEEAVVRSGKREQVFVVREPGKFEPRAVRLGVSAQGMVQVLDGLAAGEQVVTSSQFLIDSDSRLREATAKMLETLSTEQGGGHDPGNH
jgi:membrane fusion protein, copper/silver efflux system